MSNQLLKLLEQCKKHTFKIKRIPRNKKSASAVLEKRISTSPYAAMLASPLRLCAFHQRIFPSRLLLRFGIGWHPATNQLWAYPTLGKRHEYNGKGYYVSLGQDVLEWVQNGLYRSVFRKEGVIYRTDMADLIRTQLVEDAYKSFHKYPMSRFDLLRSIPDNYSKYQCVLLLSSNSKSLLHEMKDSIPYYNISLFWSHHDIKSKFKPDIVALGVPRDKNSVDLAISLWRCHLHLKK